jgi:hypothetical protein
VSWGVVEAEVGSNLSVTASLPATRSTGGVCADVERVRTGTRPGEGAADGPIDMRMDPTATHSAEVCVDAHQLFG